MSFPIEFRFDFDVFKIALILSKYGIALWFSIITIVVVSEGVLLKLFESWKLLGIFLFKTMATFPILFGGFIFPVLIGSFIQPLTRSRKHLVLRGTIVLALSLVVYSLIYKFLSLAPLYPFPQPDFTTILIVALCFHLPILAIYLPSILKIEKES